MKEIENIKFPQSWEQAKFETETIRIVDGSKIHINNYDEAAKLMAEQYEARIAELESQWISVDDRLPEVGEYVLCYYYPRNPVMEGRVVGIKHRFDTVDSKQASRLNLDLNGFGNCSQVTHWMPLPKPPTK